MHPITILTFLLSSGILVSHKVLTAKGVVNVCDLPKVVGTCNAQIKRFHFDAKTGKCLRFFYSGCDRNDNNFKTRDDCLKACQKRVCSLPKDMGPCEAAINNWFYNIETMRCEKFIYGGCQGNKNNFETKERCEQKCTGVKKNPCPTPPPCAPPPPGSCPRFTNSIVNGVKCVVGCSYPRCKEGTCPNTATAALCTTLEPACVLDLECAADRLCCSGCCRKPVSEPKSGKCPVDNHQRYCPLLKSECERDGQCAGKRKCCQFSCSKFCVDPDS